MQDIIVLEWTYSPTDFFEGVIQADEYNYQMKFEAGSVKVRISSDIYDATPGMREALHGTVDCRFLSNQLLTPKPYSLSKSSESRLRPDGPVDVRVFPEGRMLISDVGSPDILTGISLLACGRLRVYACLPPVGPSAHNRFPQMVPLAPFRPSGVLKRRSYPIFPF